MRIVVCPHDMGTGGSQLNAVELAAAVQAAGHDVVLYAPAGRLVELASDLGLRIVESPEALRPSRRWASGLDRLVRSWRPDVVHTYEWAPALAASFGAHLRLGVPVVMTVLSMDVPGFLPRHLDLIVGTRELFDAATRHAHRHLMVPPVDTVANAPADPAPARARWGIGPDESVIAIVGRMTADLDKAAGVHAAIDAVDVIAAEAVAGAAAGSGAEAVAGSAAAEPDKGTAGAGPDAGQAGASVRPVLIAAGDGPELPGIRAHADAVNARHGRPVVRTPGNLLDPRPAYAAADVVLGMGSSALRGMAFGRPVIVLGAAGFHLPVTPKTLGVFTAQGFYGTGRAPAGIDGMSGVAGTGRAPAGMTDMPGVDGAQGLAAEIADVLSRPRHRRRLGDWSRAVVEEHYSLTRAADRLLDIYASARKRRAYAGRTMLSLARSAAGAGSSRLHRLRAGAPA